MWPLKSETHLTFVCALAQISSLCTNCIYNRPKKSPYHPSAFLIHLGGSVVVFLERDAFRCLEVCCQALPCSTGAERRKSAGGIPLLLCSHPRAPLPLCWGQSKGFAFKVLASILGKGENWSKMHQTRTVRASWEPCAHSMGVAQPLLRMVLALLRDNQNIISYCWFLNQEKAKPSKSWDWLKEVPSVPRHLPLCTQGVLYPSCQDPGDIYNSTRRGPDPLVVGLLLSGSFGQEIIPEVSSEQCIYSYHWVAQNSS